MEGNGHKRHSSRMDFFPCPFLPSPSARTDDLVHKATALLVADEACPWDRSLPPSLLPPHLPSQLRPARKRSQPEGPGSAQPNPACAAARRAGKSAMPAQRAAALIPPFVALSPASFPNNATNPLFKVALPRYSGTLASLPEKARKWGVVTSSTKARSQFHWGRVACAHVQPATVKAHAPVRSRLLTSGFGRRPEWT